MNHTNPIYPNGVNDNQFNLRLYDIHGDEIKSGSSTQDFLRESAYRSILGILNILPFGFDEVAGCINDLEHMANVAEKPYSSPSAVDLSTFSSENRAIASRYITAHLIKSLVTRSDALRLCQTILDDDEEDPLIKLRAAVVLVAAEGPYARFSSD